jgi:hypothetical protein
MQKSTGTAPRADRAREGFAVAMLACFIPGRHASNVDPLLARRTE